MSVCATPVIVDYNIGINRIQVTIIQFHTNKCVKKSHATLLLDGHSYRTSTSSKLGGLWNESFLYDVPLHSQLFSVLQVDLYETRNVLPDVHIGRCEIKINLLFGLPSPMISWYELWERKESEGNTSIPGKRISSSHNVGAIQVKIDFSLQGEKFQFLYLDASQPDFKSLDNHLEASESAYEEYEDSYFLSGNPRDWDNASEYSERLSQSVLFLDKEDLDESSFSVASKSSSSFLDTVGDWLLSKETNSVLKNVRKIFHSFGQGIDVSHASMLSGLLKLEKFYYTVSTPRTGNIVKDLRKIEIARHFFKYSLASYGWRGLNFFGKGNGILSDSARKDSDKKSILEFLALPEDKLLEFNPAASAVFQPSYYIALDELTDSLVLTIRGTMSTIDTLTDLVCEYAEFKDGLIHSGILNASMWFYKNVWPSILLHLIEKRPSNLIICGHSLGGATASALTMIIEEILKSNEKIKVNLHCYSFASPPFVSLNLAKKYCGIIDTFVFEDDGVCRLSYGHMVDLRAMILAALDEKKFGRRPEKKTDKQSNKSVSDRTNKKWLGNLFNSNSHETTATVPEMPENIIMCRESIRNPSNLRSKSIKLYLAGTIYFMYYDDPKLKPFESLMPNYSGEPRSVNSSTKSLNKEHKPLKRVHVEISNPEYFDELILTRTVFLRHIPNVYDKAFERAFETLMIDLAEERIPRFENIKITTKGISSKDYPMRKSA